MLHDVTSREAVSGWFPLTSTGWTHYQRTCLKSAASYPSPAWYNSSCTQDTDCPDPFSLCSSGRCLCALGAISSEQEVTCRAAGRLEYTLQLHGECFCQENLSYL